MSRTYNQENFKYKTRIQSRHVTFTLKEKFALYHFDVLIANHELVNNSDVIAIEDDSKNKTAQCRKPINTSRRE
ncbi:Protein of unknown function [Gryllus bimaculatus]|nr:Protein of unknown function [Gryllus bimaculatus]